MAKVKPAAIEAALRRIVRAAAAKEEPVTVKQVRNQAEKELELEQGFLLEDEWKSRSRDIVKAAFEEEQEEAEAGPDREAVPAKVTDAEKTGKRREESVNGVHRKFEIAPPPTEIPLANDNEESDNGDDESSDSDIESRGESADGDTEKNAANATPGKLNHVPTQVNGVKRKAAAEVRGKEGDESSSEDDSAAEPPAKKSKASASTNPTNSQSNKSSGNITSPEQASARLASTAKGEAEGASQSSLQATPAQHFAPPSGYMPIDTTNLSQTPSISASDLEGKQIWQIIVPSSIPLSALSELTADAVNSANASITINGLDYSLTSDSSTSSAGPPTLLLPTPKGYKPVKRKVDRTLILQQRITLPNITSRQINQATGSSAAADTARAAVSTVRPQPKGLRMRYRPPGFGPGKLGALGSGEDSASDDGRVGTGSTFQFPRALGAHGTAKRNISGEDLATFDANVGATVDAKAEKKRKKEEKRQRQGKQSGQSIEKIQPKVNGLEEHSPPKSRAHGFAMSNSPDLAEVLPADIAQDQDSRQDRTEAEDKAKLREEKAKRKEERRLKRERKDAKRRAKEEASALQS